MRIRVFFAALCLAALLPTSSARAQAAAGRLTVTVLDSTSAPVPAVTVSLVAEASREAKTDSAGVARFTRVVPGNYRVTATPTGATAHVLPHLSIDGADDLRLTLVIPGTTGTAPGRWTLTDASSSVSTTIAGEEIDRLPLTGDVWSVLRTLPAIVIDRVNVGGADSVSQPVISTNGASPADNTWSIDGVPVTNLSTLGLSTAYAGLSLLDHVRATTGGVDPSIATSGAGVNLQLKSGGDVTRASADVSFGTHALTAKLPAASTAGVQSYRRVSRDVDGGFDIGGPLSGKTLFGWGGYSVLAPALDVLNRQGTSFAASARDSAVTHAGAFKLAWVKSANTRLTFTYFASRKARDGEDAGPARPAETSIDGRTTSQFGAVRLDRVVSTNLSITARYALAPATIALDPAGGRGVVAYQDTAGVWRNSYQFADDHQLQHALAVDGDYRWHGQDLRFGADLRRVSIDDTLGWPGGQFDASSGDPVLFAEAIRDRRSLGHALYLDAYAGDTWRWRRLTLDAGVRWDRQAGSIDAVTIDANPVASSALPALSVPSQSNAIVWSLVSGRGALAFALDRAQHTVLRATYARFASPLDAALAPLLGGAPLESAALVTAIDKNGDHVLSPGDVFTVADTAITNTRIGSVSTPRTDAFAGAITHTTTAGIAVRGVVTFRRLTGTNWLHLDGITGTNFSTLTTITGNIAPINAFAVPLSRVNGALLPANFLQTYESRAGYAQQFLGFEASAAGEMAGGTPWRIGVSSGQTREQFDSAAAHYDPTPQTPGLDPLSLASPNVDAGDVARASVDSNGQPLFVTTPRYQVFATTTIRLPWRLRATPAYYLREGFALPYFDPVPGSADATSPDGKNVLLTGAIAAFRLPAVHEVDVRVSHPLGLFGRDSWLDVDVFNVLNRATPLARELDARSPFFNQITEVLSPLTVRIGVRVPIR
jgi:hypothetical protein